MADLAAQVAANDPYILPDDTTIGSAPTGYQTATDSIASEVGTKSGQFYVRDDVAAALVNTIGSGSILPDSLPISNQRNDASETGYVRVGTLGPWAIRSLLADSHGALEINRCWSG